MSDKPAVPALGVPLLLLLYSVRDTKPCGRSRSAGSRSCQALGAMGNLGLEIVALFQTMGTPGWSRKVCSAFEKHM